MSPEFNPMDPALENAVREIRDEAVDQATIDAAAARVWARLSEQTHTHIRSCADFQALIPEYRAGRLNQARSLLLKDHLHQCVACRRVFEGKVVSMPGPVTALPPKRSSYATRWAMGAVAAAAAVVLVYVAYDQYGVRSSQAIVQAVDGTLLVVSADGIHPLLAGQQLPASGEIRTEKDSGAVLQLQDGSTVEMRERSSLTAEASGRDITIHLGQGSVIVEAAHRRTGHLYVNTADCRVAVTGTVFGVTAGIKGSRVSVVQGEVHVTQDTNEKILHPGDQAVTSSSVEPASLQDELAWSRNREQLLKQVNEVRKSLEQIHLPALRYSSKLIGRLPANTVLLVSIPNLAQYLTDAQAVLAKKLAENPQTSAWWADHSADIGAVMETVRAGSEYLGEEIDIVAPRNQAPVMLAEQRKDGFADFLRKKNVPFKVEAHDGVLVFGPDNSVAKVAGQLDSGFQATTLYSHVADAFHDGAGLLICADLAGSTGTPAAGARYFIAQQKQAGDKMIASATLGFDGPRTGMAAWLAEPSPMGSLEYVSPDATMALAFAVKNAAAIIDGSLAATRGSGFADAQKSLADERQQAGFDVRQDLAASLGGEFTLAMDGPVVPVPSWKLVAEVYDPVKFQTTLQKLIDATARDATAAGRKPLRTGQEVVDGRTYYMVAAPDAGPLMEAHYTFDRGYLVAGPTRVLVTHALQTRTSGTSIKHSAKFLELTPRDHYLNYSALAYQNLGTTLAPIMSLIGSMVPSAPGRPNPLASMGDIKPALYAVYGESDRITMTADGDAVGSALAGLMSGNLLSLGGMPLPLQQFHGTGRRQTPYPVK